MLAFTALLPLIAVHTLLRLKRLRIGVAGDRIHLRGMNGRSASAPAADVRHSNRRLRIGNTVVPIRPGAAWFFKRGILEQHLFPLLLPQNRTPDWKLIPMAQWIMIPASVALVTGIWLTRHYWLP